MLTPTFIPIWHDPKYNANNDLVCDWCGYAVPVAKSGKIMDWISPKGTFCSKSHASAGMNNITWRTAC